MVDGRDVTDVTECATPRPEVLVAARDWAACLVGTEFARGVSTVEREDTRFGVVEMRD